MKTALITGVTGQDGSYLAEFLLERGYRVAGMVRRSSTENFERIEHLRERMQLRLNFLLSFNQNNLATPLPVESISRLEEVIISLKKKG